MAVHMGSYQEMVLSVYLHCSAPKTSCAMENGFHAS